LRERRAHHVREQPAQRLAHGAIEGVGRDHRRPRDPLEPARRGELQDDVGHVLLGHPLCPGVALGLRPDDEHLRPLDPQILDGRRSVVAPYFCRSSFLSILPTLVLSIASTKRTRSGIAAFDSVPAAANARRWFLMASAVMAALHSARGTTRASGRSPQRLSGTPMTATSATAGCRDIRFSSSSDETHSPPLLMTSFRRSVICT